MIMLWGSSSFDLETLLERVCKGYSLGSFFSLISPSDFLLSGGTVSGIFTGSCLSDAWAWGGYSWGAFCSSDLSSLKSITLFFCSFLEGTSSGGSLVSSVEESRIYWKMSGLLEQLNRALISCWKISLIYGQKISFCILPCWTPKTS